MRYSGKDRILFCVAVALASVSLFFLVAGCNRSSGVELYGKFTFVHFVDDGANGYQVSSQSSYLRKGTSFSQRDNDALFGAFQIQGYELDRFFLSKDGLDLIKSGDYISPSSLSSLESKMGKVFYREPQSKAQSSLSTYYFDEGLVLYAYYVPIEVESIEFVERYSDFSIQSADDIEIEVNVLPKTAANKKVTWTLTTNTSSAVSVEETDTAFRGIATAPGKFTLTATSGDVSATCEITVTERYLVRPVIIDRTSKTELFKPDAGSIDKVLEKYQDLNFEWSNLGGAGDVPLEFVVGENAVRTPEGAKPGIARVKAVCKEEGLEFYFRINVINVVEQSGS